MWTTESLWFEVSIVSIIYALGNILMGHFEEQTPKLRRVGKYLLTIIIVCGISVYLGRTVSMIFLSCFIIPLIYVHGYYLPKKKGINGWTGEPKSKYYEFRKWNKDIFSKWRDPFMRSYLVVGLLRTSIVQFRTVLSTCIVTHHWRIGFYETGTFLVHKPPYGTFPIINHR